MEMQVEENGSTVGPWTFEAHIEVRSDAVTPTAKLEKGDVWFRMVLRVEYSDDTGENGVEGELSTPWLWSVAECAKQAKLLRGMTLSWLEYDESTNDYIRNSGNAHFDEIIDGAVARFMATMPGVS